MYLYCSQSPQVFQRGRLPCCLSSARLSPHIQLDSESCLKNVTKSCPDGDDEHMHLHCSEERAKRVSDARSQRADRYRQDKEKHAVMLQLQQQQLREEEAAAAAAAAEGQEEGAKGRPAALHSMDDHNLTLIIKADVQVATPQPAVLKPLSKKSTPAVIVECNSSKM